MEGAQAESLRPRESTSRHGLRHSIYGGECEGVRLERKA